METITLHNYQAFLLDYQEGTLSPDMKQVLLKFLNAHPEIKAALNTYENIILEADSVTYPKRKQLKKPAEPADETLVVDYLEHNLPLKEHGAFRNSLKTDAALKGTLVTYEKTILTADNTIVYSQKGLLKKRVGIRPVYYLLPFAASVLVVLFIYFQKPAVPLSAPTVQLQLKSMPTPAVSPVIAGVSLSSSPTLEHVNTTCPPPREETIKAVAKSPLLSLPSVTLPELNPIPVKDIPLDLALEATPVKGLQLTPIQDQVKSYLTKQTTALLGEEASNSPVFQHTNKKSLFDFIALGVNSIGKLTGANIGLKQKMAADGTPINTTITAGRHELTIASRGK